jgi:polyhydroxybutyrate depolymerase
MKLRVGYGALIALALLLAGCAPSIAPAEPEISTAGQVQQNLIEVGGLSRSYIVRAPAEASGPLPVVVVLHGAGGNAERAEVATGFTARATDFIAVYPNGTQAAAIDGELAWDAGACCGNPVKQQINDVAFISAVLDDVVAQYSVDSSRIYVTGFSNGGMLSYRLACELGSRIAAVAIVGGALNVADCAAPDPMSVLVIHGRNDLTVPYSGGESNARTAARFGQWSNTSVAASVAFWRDRDECDLDPVVSNEGPVSTEHYEGCVDDSNLALVSIAEGTHIWPTVANENYDATSAILSFFRLS